MPNSQKLITLENLQQFKTKTDATYYKKTDKVASATVADSANAVAWANVSGKPSLATLDTSGKVPASQLPSYVDDVLEYDNKAAFPETGEAGKIYIAKDTNLQYRWSGTAYVEISSSLALGETASTAYAGNKGKQNADDIAAIKAGTIKVGSATRADSATSATSATNATNATKATQDASGNVITTTYATKAEVTALQDDLEDGTIKVGSASNADHATSATSATTATSATSATKATQDGDGNVISTTYAKKSEIPEGVTVDSEMSTTSTNPVQNKVVKAAIDAVDYKATSAQSAATSANNGITNITNGNLVVKKAEQDASGNNIANTYAKKTDIANMVTTDTMQTITATKIFEQETNTYYPITFRKADLTSSVAIGYDNIRFNQNSHNTTIKGAASLSANNTVTLPSVDGTLAVTSQLTTLVYAQNTEIDALFD